MAAPDPIAFVLGATGYVGSHLVDVLVDDPGVGRVIAHARPGSARADERAAEWSRRGAGRPEVDRTPLEPEALAGALERHRPSHLFLCHGTTRRQAAREGIDDPYFEVDVGLTTMLCQAALGLVGPDEPGPRVVYLSSMGASPYHRSPYLAARGAAEEYVRGSGLPFTLCRAPLISGPDRGEPRPLESLGRRLLDPLLGALGALGMRRTAARHRSMDGREVAEGLARSGFHYQTINRVVLPDELRREGVYEKERWVPASRRDTDRFS